MDFETTMKVIHQANMELLQEMDRICRKHKIPYYLLGGALIGCLRGGTLIPWDDDVDVLLFREDYERFMEVCPGEISAGFRLLDFAKQPQFFDFITKISNERITYEKTAFGDDDFYDYRYNHPTLDLFVLDNRPGAFSRHTLRMRLIYLLAMGHRKTIHYQQYAGIYRIAAFLGSKIGKLIPMQTIAAWYTKAQKSEKTPNGLYYLSNDMIEPGLWGLLNKQEWFDGEREECLNGIMFPVPYDTEAILTMQYGDYMQLPPEDKRRPQHVMKIVER